MERMRSREFAFLLVYEKFGKAKPELGKNRVSKFEFVMSPA